MSVIAQAVGTVRSGHRVWPSSLRRCYPDRLCSRILVPLHYRAGRTQCPRSGMLIRQGSRFPAERRLIVRAGIGWPAGNVDHVTLGADIGSPVAFAYQTGQSGMSNHLEQVIRLPNAETSRRTWDQARDKRAYPAGWRGRHLSRSRTSPSRLSTRSVSLPARREEQPRAPRGRLL